MNNIETPTVDEKIITVNIEDLYSQLSVQQKAFVTEYLSNGYNGTKAAEKLAKKATKKPESNRVEAVRYLQTPIIKEYIKVYFEQIRLDNQTDVNKYIDELNRLAFIQSPTRQETVLKLKALDLLQKVYYGNEKKSLSVTDKDGAVIKVEYV